MPEIDYIKQLESQNEELKKLLANSDRLVDYWRDYVDRYYQVTTHYIPININTFSGELVRTENKAIDMRDVFEIIEDDLSVLGIRKQKDINSIHVSRIRGSFQCWFMHIAFNGGIYYLRFGSAWNSSLVNPPTYAFEHKNLFEVINEMKEYARNKGWLDE